jgi:glutaryl-CoA dehydrogenase (non-decarboxylating)
MDLSLTQEHEMVAKMVRDFAGKEVAPVIKEHDREQRHIPWVFKRLGELGILGICLPVRLGGAGMDYISLGLACEELERVDTGLWVILSVHVGLNSLALFQWGNEEQKENYLTPQAKGEKIATCALTEPGAGSDAAGIRTTAKRRGDKYILNGEKMWISLADVADQFLILAKTEPEKRHKGMTAFIVRTYAVAITGLYLGA